MRRLLLVYLSVFCVIHTQGQQRQANLSQSPWHIVAEEINPNNYFGITVANGMVGLVSSPEPMKVSDVVLNDVYDYYQRDRVILILPLVPGACCRYY